MELSACLALAFNSTMRQNTTGEERGGGRAIYPMAARKQGVREEEKSCWRRYEHLL